MVDTRIDNKEAEGEKSASDKVNKATKHTKQKQWIRCQCGQFHHRSCLCSCLENNGTTPSKKPNKYPAKQKPTHQRIQTNRLIVAKTVDKADGNHCINKTLQTLKPHGVHQKPCNQVKPPDGEKTRITKTKWEQPTTGRQEEEIIE